jgi:multidrug efflux pump subunit AcrB
MKALIDYFIKYPLWANVLMLAVLLGGIASMQRMKSSLFPEVEGNTIAVELLYPGTSPEEIEESLILKIENNLRGISGVERTTSMSRENRGSVTIEVIDNYNVDEVYDDVRNAVDRISPWPAGAERPVVRINKMRSRALSVALVGKSDLWALKERAESFRDELLAIPGISQVSLSGIPNREIAVTLSETQRRRYGISFDALAAAISRANVDLSGGTILTKDEQLLIRAYGRRDYAHEIRSLPLIGASDGSTIRIGDVAVVNEQWEESPNATYYNGKRAVVVTIEKTTQEDILDIARKVNAHTQTFAQRYPEVSVQVISDATIDLRKRIDILVSNGMVGFVLVVLTLGMFLNGRLSFWVASGIPIAFAGMFIVAYMVGITINVISLMGMIIVVGILVDDAIVVAESIYQKHEQGISARKAAIEGTSEVFAPVFTSVLTTIIAFLPFFFFQGAMGNVIWQLALVVIGALSFSLIESIFILPAHLAHSKGLEANANSSRMRQFFDGLYRTLTDKVYAPALRWTQKNIWIVLAIPLAYSAVTIGLLRGGVVELSAFPFIDSDNLDLNLTMTTGTRETITDSLLQQMEATVWGLNNQLKQQRSDKRDVILSIKRQLGSNGLGDNGGHSGMLSIELMESGKRKIPSFQISNRIRQAIGTIPGSQKLSFGAGRWGKALSISLLSNDLQQLDKAKELLKQKLAEYPTLSDVTDSDVEGWREVRLQLSATGIAAGLTLSDVARQVRQGFFGLEVQRYQRGEDEIQVWVRYDDATRSSLGNLETMQITTPSGAAYPLSAIATYSIQRGRVGIAHLNGRREVKVEADLVDPLQSVNTILADVKRTVIPSVLSQTQGVQVSYEGRERENIKFARSVKSSYPLALLAIAVVLILVFRSPLQAIIVMLMIPLGLMGAVWGHLFHGFMISRLSMFGIVALAGIVINDSIVLIDQINRNLRDRIPLNEAIFQAGLSRLRPILLTTITTVAGMAPLILDNSRQAQFLIPMAISLVYGLSFGSLFILFVVPALFMALNQLRLLLAQLLNGAPTPEAVEPAVRELELESHGGL